MATREPVCGAQLRRFRSKDYFLLRLVSVDETWVSFAQEFQCCYFCESSCLFYLSFNFDFYVSKIMHSCATYSIIRKIDSLLDSQYTGNKRV